MSDHPQYVRRRREGRLSFSTKLYQGIGAIPDTVKNWAFNTFTLLFYNQILGMDAFFVSIALAIATPSPTPSSRRSRTTRPPAGDAGIP